MSAKLCATYDGLSDLEGPYGIASNAREADMRQFAEMSHVEAEQNRVMIGSNFCSALILAQPIALAGHVVFHALAGA
jgi:hypothetical protein